MTEMGQVSRNMAQEIIDKGLKEQLTEVWGSEVTLYYPDLYAGATDVVGIYKGRESILDFKQSNKLKRREWIDDYCIQLGAYAMAHNYVHKTKIDQGVILMCTPAQEFQCFIVEGKEFVNYQHQFLKRVDQYYGQIKK
jgi:genome maintenance exonuclease 1